MKKDKLETFIKKYSLGGFIEHSKLISNGTDLKTVVMDSESRVVGVIKGNGFNLEEFEIGIYNTSELKKLLSILSEDINVGVLREDDVARSLEISDKSSKVNFMLAEMESLDKVPNKIDVPNEYELHIKLTEDFVSRFIKSQSVLSDIESATLLMKKDELKFVLGYEETINSNCVTLEVITEKDKDVIPSNVSNVSLSSKYLREILLANSEIKNPILYVSMEGICKLELNSNDFESEYYLMLKVNQ